MSNQNERTTCKTIKDISDFLAELRIIPRVMAFMWAYIAWEAWVWFSVQDDISTGQGAFLSAITASAVGFCKLYLDTGDPRE
jgi:hypothetical protein